MNQKLILIDGNAIMHRAFHALPFLNSKDGQPTNAVYGFILILFKIIETHHPDFLAVCFDRKAPTFRKKLYKDYQIKRPEMDKDLVPQIDLMHEVLKGMQIPIYEKDGYEADDVLATIVQQVNYSSNPDNHRGEKLTDDSSHPTKSGSNNKIEIIIATGDRDLLQLVSDQVKLLMPAKGLQENKIYGIEETKERIGVAPHLIPYYKGLAGDQSDNYPGVNGIGPKTAVNLINQFGSLENIYKNIEEIKNKNVKEKLLKDKENAFLSYKLACVVNDAPIKFDLDQAKIHDLATRQAIDIFGNLGFKKLMARLLTINDKTEKITIQEPIKIDKKEDQMQLF